MLGEGLGHEVVRADRSDTSSICALSSRAASASAQAAPASAGIGVAAALLQHQLVEQELALATAAIAGGRSKLPSSALRMNSSSSTSPTGCRRGSSSGAAVAVRRRNASRRRAAGAPRRAAARSCARAAACRRRHRPRYPREQVEERQAGREIVDARTVAKAGVRLVGPRDAVAHGAAARRSGGCP